MCLTHRARSSAAKPIRFRFRPCEGFGKPEVVRACVLPGLTEYLVANSELRATQRPLHVIPWVLASHRPVHWQSRRIHSPSGHLIEFPVGELTQHTLVSSCETLPSLKPPTCAGCFRWDMAHATCNPPNMSRLTNAGVQSVSSGRSSSSSLTEKYRRNGKLQSCEPCRKSKLRCDREFRLCAGQKSPPCSRALSDSARRNRSPRHKEL